MNCPSCDAHFTREEFRALPLVAYCGARMATALGPLQVYEVRRCSNCEAHLAAANTLPYVSAAEMDSPNSNRKDEP